MEEKNILSSIVDYLKPKAHDAIDGITTQWKESQARINEMMPNEEMQELLQTMVMGSIGGVGKKALRGKDAYIEKMKKMIGRDTPLTRRETYGLKTLQDPNRDKKLDTLVKHLIKTGDYEKISRHWKNFPPNMLGHRWFNKPKK